MTTELATTRGIQNGGPMNTTNVNTNNGVALSPAMSVSQAVQAYKTIQEIVSKVLVEGRDYGVIPGTRGGPSLWKPGAEKLCGIFGLAVTIAHIETNRQENSLEYTVTVELVSRHTGAVVGQGIGSCNSGERKYKSVLLPDLQNTLLKMAKKRAQIDAVLSATGASGFFEDEDDAPSPRPQQRSQQAPQQRPQRNAPQQGTQQGAPTQSAQTQNPMTNQQREIIEELALPLYGENWRGKLQEWQQMPLDDWGQRRADQVIAYMEKEAAESGIASAAQNDESTNQAPQNGPQNADDTDPFADED